MERTEHSLVPQWLKNNGSITSGGRKSNQLTSSSNRDPISAISNGYGHSRSHGSFDRNELDMDWKKDTSNFFSKGKVNHGGRKQVDHSKSMNNILFNRFERDLLQHSRSMASGKRFSTWYHKNMVDLSDAKSNHDKSDGMAAEGLVGSMHKTMSKEEFPLLGAEERQGGSDMGRVLSSSSSSSPATHKLWTGKPDVIFSNDLTSTLHGTPVSAGSSSTVSGLCQHTVSACCSSMAPSMVGLNMAETLAQGTPRPIAPPQSSVDEQRRKELAIKQSRLLIPMTPSMPRALVVSPLEKSKVKAGQQHPFSSPHPTNHSVHGGPAKPDVLTTTSGNSRLVRASQELNGASSAAKENFGPSGSGVVTSSIGTTKTTSISAPSRISSDNSNPVVWTTLERRPSQAQSRSEFFKNLSRKSALKSPSYDVCPSRMQFTSEPEVVTGNGSVSPTLQSRDATFVETSAVNSRTVSSSTLTDNGNAGGEPLKLSNNGQQHLNSNPNLFSDEEEAAFLHSLGWEENAGEDEGLTEEEIQDFYEKYMKLQPSANIHHNLHPKVISGSCGRASS